MSIKQIFVNLSVRDLDKTKVFWENLGFSFNPKFTNEKAGCLILGENIFVMLLREEFFKTFIDKEISDSNKTTEVINAISVSSREEVDTLVEKAYSEGARSYKEKPDDYGWMYSRAFEDLDGHFWEVLYADESQFPDKPGESHNAT